ncbi:MAG: hypothetical protein HY308_05210 [Gammaproteobacteria bacterium]|nr:hypothetical protein [Gammaproteobacteria bacterium]
MNLNLFKYHPESKQQAPAAAPKINNVNGARQQEEEKEEVADALRRQDGESNSVVPTSLPE